MPREIAHERALGALPLFDIVSTCRGRDKAVFSRVDVKRAYALLMVRQRGHCLPRRQIPEPDRAVHRSGDDLWVGRLRANNTDGASMSCKNMHLRFCTHVPDTGRCISPGGDEDIESGVEGEGIDT
jgi:hypothetical protein